MKCFSTTAMAIMAISHFFALPSSAYQHHMVGALKQSDYQYIDYADSPNLCDGQIAGEGLICITTLPENQLPGLRLARMGLYFTSLSIESIDVYELDQNDGEVSFVIVIDRIVRTSLNEPLSRFPVVRAYIKDDGSTAVDFDYGDFPPGYSPEEESIEVLERHQSDIEKLISSLLQTR